MNVHDFKELVWREVAWQRPFVIEAVWDMLSHLAAAHPRGAVVWECRGSGGKIRYLLGAERQHLDKIERIFKAHGDVHFGSIYQTPRKETAGAAQLKTSKKLLSLNLDTSMAVLRAGLAALANTGENEELTVQAMLGGSYGPVPLSGGMQDPNASWLEIITGNVQKATSDMVKSAKEKAEQSGFQAVIRIGSSSRKDYIDPLHNLTAAFRILESAGVKIYTASENPKKLTEAGVPWRFPLRLSVKELSGFMLLPVGEDTLPGTVPLHPKAALPPGWYREPMFKNEDRSFAAAMNGERLSISPKDALEHTIILGPTGSGKSTAMLNLILSDITAGRGVLVIDPKQDLVDDVLERIPAHRRKDVVVVDPASPEPVGFNPLACTEGQDKELTADTVLSVLKEIFADSWGVRAQDILSAAILTLMEVDGASLMWLPELLTNEKFRASITKTVKDEIALKPFWTRFENLTPYQRQQMIEPVLNKLRQFLLRPKLRNCLGQGHPKFDLNDLYTKARIVLVPLNKGVIGGESARLLGSLIVGLAWTLALGRANVPQEQRKMVSIYIDELQDYLSLPTDLSDALAQARGMGLAITMAHQYRDQLPPLLRSGVDANARNKIIFGISGKDAKDMAAMADGLEALDFASLMRYHVYASFQSGGKNTGWVQGVTLPKPEPLQGAAELRAASMERYGTPSEAVEAELKAIFKDTATPPQEEAKGFKKSGIGRRRKEQNDE